MGFLADCREDLRSIRDDDSFMNSVSEVLKGDTAVTENKQAAAERQKEEKNAPKVKRPGAVRSFVQGITKGAKDRTDIKRGYDPNKTVAQARVFQDVMQDDDGYGY